MFQRQQIGWVVVIALVATAAGSPNASSPASGGRKQQNAGGATQAGGHDKNPDADAETFGKIDVTNKNMEVANKRPGARNGRVNQAENPLNALGKSLKKASNNALGAISNTFKSGQQGQQQSKKKNQAKKNKAKPKQGSSGQGNRPERRTTVPNNPDYSDIEVDEDGNPVVLNEEDIPVEASDMDPKSANGTDDTGEDFPPYGGDYSGVDEGPISYPDENPPPRRNKNKNKGKGKKTKGKKGAGGKKAVTAKKKRNKNKLNIHDSNPLLMPA